MNEALYQRTTRMEAITGVINSPYGINTQNTNFATHSTLVGIVVFFISTMITGIQVGEMSKLGWLIGWSIRDM
jgi:hypothetical protein